MDRRPSLQSITWLLNLNRYKQLDLNPPYQRRSVWSLREKQRFLDTILRNYPSPAIFFHTSLDDEGNPTYHVVDGKQRLSTILDFVDNKIRLPKDYGDSRLRGANWKALEEFPSARKAFWRYQLLVEQLDDVQEAIVKEIFERLNRNSRKLEPQEMRHARFDGWLITYLEAQADAEIWKQLKVSTLARRKRMADVQILSEFAEIMLRRQVVGFDQEGIDFIYAMYEDPAESVPDFDGPAFTEAFESNALFLRDMNLHNSVITEKATSRNHLYPLWATVALTDLRKKDASACADKYLGFHTELERLRILDAGDPTRDRSTDNTSVQRYLSNSTGASTEEPQRRARFEALRDYLLTE
ncbi:hypothetical protein IN07_14375 [Modestobacter caceresii]|uniref:GmrSD restriction endonucleases N-terminal domain-containing protein n=2 Tax=Modestobacter caceresii TaxID=1522368 RepID=A0A098Y8C9_9ACTN|nr:hypothetical protein IN07_14375 [Modestobacter caceresii]